MRRTRGEPVIYNPIRRLAAAMMLLTVQDAHFPTKKTEPNDIVSAREFLNSDDGQFMLAELLGRA